MSTARRARVLLRFAYRISHISYLISRISYLISHTHNLLVSYLVSYSGGSEFERGDFPATSSKSLFKLLLHTYSLTYYTYYTFLLTYSLTILTILTILTHSLTYSLTYLLTYLLYL